MPSDLSKIGHDNVGYETAVTTRGLRPRLLFYASLAILPALGLAIVTATEVRRLEADRARQEALRAARLAAVHQEALIEGARQVLMTLANDPRIRARDNGCSAILGGLLAKNPRYANFGVADPSGAIVCSALPFNSQVSIADQQWLTRAVSTSDFAVGNYQLGRVAGEPTLDIFYRLIDDRGKADGVIFVSLNLSWINLLAVETGLAEGSSLTIFDGKGTILARHPEPDLWIGRSAADTPLYRALVASGKDSVVEVEGVDGVRRIFAFTALDPQSGVILAVGTPSGLVFARVNRITGTHLGGLGAVVLLALVAGIVGLKDVVGPLGTLLRATRRLASGDLSARTELSSGPTEIHQLSVAFDEMAESLERITRRTEGILNSVGEGIYGVDLEGRATFVNPAAETILGWSAGELIGTFVHPLIHHSRPDGTPYPVEQCPIYAAFKDGEVRHVDDEFFWRKDGTKFPVDYLSTPIRQGGRITGAVVTFRDITEHKRNQEARLAREAAEEASRAKSDFLSRMSHELRTPLNAILGFAQLLQHDGLTEPQLESVDQILKGGRHLLDLINEILDIARIESGRMQISLEPVPLAEVIQECVALIAPLAAKEGLLLQADPTPTETHVLADRQRLKQVLLNLLSNATKYNREHGKVGIACQRMGKERIRINVSDTGTGIPSDRLGGLFVPFSRLGLERQAIQGTGLGLALSKGLVEMMGGMIGVQSDVGRGSTFWVELPLTGAPLARLETQAFVSETAGTDAEKEETRSTILYVEDNLSNLRLIERILAGRPGIRLLSAMQGRLGLELAREHQPDVILLDLNLPDMPGEEVFHRLRQDPQTEKIPVIVISADATPGQIQRLLTAGANAYLTKPLDVTKFLKAIEETAVR